jgi:sulfatase maturation enzyme AslB (radical SAM superfamily)
MEFRKFVNLRDLNTQEWTVDPAGICTLDLKLGNLCNLKCVMCGGNASSQLMTEYVQHKEKFNKIKNYWTPNTEVDFAWPLSTEFQEFISRFQHNLKWIKFTGGEPTLIPYVLDFLSQIECPEEVTVSLITNGTTYNTQLFEVLKKFKTLWLNVSLEGIKKHNDLIRYKSKWAEVEQNILAYKQLPNVRFVINHVLQAFSVHTLLPLLKWCEEHELKLIFTLLLGPVFLTLNTVSPGDIEQFRLELTDYQNHVKLNSDIIPGVLSVLKDYVHNSTLEQERLQYLSTLDDIRNTDLVGLGST